MSEVASVVVVCEGYFDRSFWRGWLSHLGCASMDRQGKLMDPWGAKVANGHFGFYSRSGKSFIRVIPCEGIDNVLKQTRTSLQGLATRPIARIVVNLDSDESDPSGRAAENAIASAVTNVFSDAVKDDCGHFTLAGGVTRISPVIWRDTEGGPITGVPELQALERLVCGAIREVHPERGDSVARWLASRPALSASSENKAHAWSYMAGWYAERGCSNFYEALWEEPALIASLKAKLVATGAWSVAEEIAQ